MQRDLQKGSVAGAILAAVILFVTAARDVSAQKGGKAGPNPPAKHWTITVGPGACDLTENGQPAPKQTISKSKRHKIVWNSNAGQSLSIVVHVPANCPIPFQNMTKKGVDPQGNELWALDDCNNGQCSPGPAVPKAFVRDYKYDQILDGKSCDGMIIIER
jgi:hypothetical protein